jgi:hypothetical protein
MTRASEPVSITPIIKNTFPEWRREGENNGATEFSFSRFLVPYLCGYRGHAIFVDGADMLALGDVSELWAMRSHRHAVQVVKHAPYKVQDVKMWDQANRQYPKKNWSSVMLFNCEWHHCHELTPENVATKPGSWLHQFEWTSENKIGGLPATWNTLVGHDKYYPNVKLLHFTNGLPDVNPTDGIEDNLWRKEYSAMTHVTPK